MDAVRGYRWSSRFFAIVSVGCLAALPFALSCCAAFSRDEFFQRTSLADVLFDWPSGFRVFFFLLLASFLCTAATTVMVFVAEWEKRSQNAARDWALLIRTALSAFVIGALYLPGVYATFLFDIPGGPHNLLWMLGISMAVALLGWPRRTALKLAVPLAVGGWFFLGLLCWSAGIPLD